MHNETILEETSKTLPNFVTKPPITAELINNTDILS